MTTETATVAERYTLTPGKLVGVIYQTRQHAAVFVGTIQDIRAKEYVVLQPITDSCTRLRFWPTRLEWPRIIAWEIFDPDQGSYDEFLQDMDRLRIHFLPDEYRKEELTRHQEYWRNHHN